MLIHLLIPLILAAPNTLQGRVTAVRDGDTIGVYDGKSETLVRLVGIDAPEYDQAFGTKAKQALASKVFGQQVRVEWVEKDKHDRILGKVMLGNRWINREMVAGGFAWQYKLYSSDETLAKAEKDARAAKSGLWADKDPIAPWDFRHAKPPRLERK